MCTNYPFPSQLATAMDQAKVIAGADCIPRLGVETRTASALAAGSATQLTWNGNYTRVYYGVATSNDNAVPKANCRLRVRRESSRYFVGDSSNYASAAAFPGGDVGFSEPAPVAATVVSPRQDVYADVANTGTSPSSIDVTLFFIEFLSPAEAN